MQSPCIREASKACFHGCCAANFLSLPPPQTAAATPTPPPATPRHDFATATASSLSPNTHFSNHESLPPMPESFSNLQKSYPQYSNTHQADQIRAQEYYHLSLSNHVCLDYDGHGLFSFSQQQQSNHFSTPPIASSSSSPPPPPPSHSTIPFFSISYKSVNLSSQVLFGSHESDFESIIRKRIMRFMNISEEDYAMVFTANQSTAFKTLADSYPFESRKNLLTIYDYDNDQVAPMVETAKRKGARVSSAEFSWPNMRIQSRKLRKMMENKRKTNSQKGLFVFPLQSKMTGARYAYLWMGLAQENGWHVLLDATGLGAKDMETLGLSLFHPDFIICSFFKIFGENPSGFGCLFVKKSIASLLTTSTIAMGGIVSLVPVMTSTPSQSQELEIVESRNIEFKGLDHADALGLILISSRTRYLVNWLVNALMRLQHPHSENGLPLVRIYGPKIRIDRGPSVAFNVFDWKGEKIDPTLVQKLADRHNISLNYGVLRHILFGDKDSEERERVLETTTRTGEGKVMCRREKVDLGVPVISASLGFLTNFDDVYRLWAFVSRFLDADFVEKERWRYMALNRTTVEV